LREIISARKFVCVGRNPSVQILKPRTDYYAGREIRRCEYAGMSHSECTAVSSFNRGQGVSSKGATQNSLRDHIDSL
jgi:hypothetical protein